MPLTPQSGWELHVFPPPLYTSKWERVVIIFVNFSKFPPPPSFPTRIYDYQCNITVICFSSPPKLFTHRSLIYLFSHYS